MIICTSSRPKFTDGYVMSEQERHDIEHALEHYEDSRVWSIVTGKQGDYRDWETDRKSTRLNSSH